MATKISGHLTVQERTQIASRFEVWNSDVTVQRWCRTVEGRNATIRQETIKNCHSKLLTVWCGMTATRVIGPYLLHDTMNAESYLQMLEDYVPTYFQPTLYVCIYICVCVCACVR